MAIGQVIEDVFYTNQKKQSIVKIKEQSDFVKDFFQSFNDDQQALIKSSNFSEESKNNISKEFTMSMNKNESRSASVSLASINTFKMPKKRIARLESIQLFPEVQKAKWVQYILYIPITILFIFIRYRKNQYNSFMVYFLSTLIALALVVIGCIIKVYCLS